MSVRYYVVIQKEMWPTFFALQEAIDRHGWPLRMTSKQEPKLHQPLETDSSCLGLLLWFEGEQIDLETEITTTPEPVGYNIELNPSPEIQPQGLFIRRAGNLQFSPISIDELLRRSGANVSINDGDKVLAITLRLNKKEKRAAAHLIACLILDFCGYGLGGGQHGRNEYAAWLMNENK